ncbi:two-component system chemotaxis response regulator CheB [Bacillus tianshenii]|uniref:Protein-glutamate methylesterase/protein-glutamine glutaminase n=1 Tax=Sutcliffiella tianshenii TaxID=1463404 RepID=A0ABS2NX10_9BACI|nr:chemotaxis response regulator protein-glutamate methylesterase [Bacillus tianshenii]MBM7619007.1 two-component system chemotaxis response regulator CheB [Bacillus tianshenii]
MKKIKVLVTDDSIFMRKLISDLLKDHPDIEVIATARNGAEAIEKVKALSPDVVTLDVEMPVMDGLEALKRIMARSPVPVIMLSSTTSTGSLNTILAIENGAVDFVAKPSGAISLDIFKVKEELIEKILLAASSNFHSLLGRNTQQKNIPLNGTLYSTMDLVAEKTKWNRSVICIGTSTGGPRALQTLLTSLPNKLKTPVFIVQHMPRQFTKSLAERLNSLCSFPVTEAVHGERVINGTAYIAPGGYHMEVEEKRGELYISLNEDIPVKGHRPAVDNLFASLSTLKKTRKIAVVLTGMGADGAIGIKKLKESGHTVAIAESEQTSIVYGMPNAAVQTGLVDHIENLEDIAVVIQQYTL